MQQEKEVQHVYLVGAKSLGAYGGYCADVESWGRKVITKFKKDEILFYLSNAIINRTYFIGCLLIFLFIVLGTAILINKIIEQCPVKVSEMLTGGRSGATHNKRSFVKNIKNR